MSYEHCRQFNRLTSSIHFHSQMQLNGNLLVLTKAFDSIPKVMIGMIPHHLQTPNSTIKQYRSEYDWLVQQRKQLAELIIHENVPSGERITN